MNYIEAKDNFIALAKFGKVIAKQLEDDGKISGMEWFKIAQGAWSHAPEAMDNIGEVYTWYMNVALHEEKARINDDFALEFDIKNEKAEKMVENVFSMISHISEIAKRVKELGALMK